MTRSEAMKKIDDIFSYEVEANHHQWLQSQIKELLMEIFDQIERDKDWVVQLTEAVIEMAEVLANQLVKMKTNLDYQIFYLKELGKKDE